MHNYRRAHSLLLWREPGVTGSFFTNGSHCRVTEPLRCIGRDVPFECSSVAVQCLSGAVTLRCSDGAVTLQCSVVTLLCIYSAVTLRCSSDAVP